MNKNRAQESEKVGITRRSFVKTGGAALAGGAALGGGAIPQRLRPTSTGVVLDPGSSPPNPSKRLGSKPIEPLVGPDSRYRT